MDDLNTGETLDFKNRLRRSRGRSGRTFVASARVTGEEQNELEEAAGAQGKALSEWAREVLLREARAPQGDALFTEIVATRMLLNLALKPILCGETMTLETFNSMLTNVRTTKHKAAQDVKSQYSNPKHKGA